MSDYTNELNKVIAELSADWKNRQDDEVERRMLDGENFIEVPYLPAAFNDDRTLIFAVPGWFEHPIKRAKIGWRRLRHRWSR